MACTKTLTLSTITCELETCSTEARVDLGTKQINFSPIAFAEDLCYCLVMASNDLYTQSYFFKYEPATNTLVLKQTYPGDVEGPVVYDAKHRKFVTNEVASDKIILYDPITETISTFNTGVGASSPRIYIPEKEKTYGTFGIDGGGLHYFGYLDLDLLTAVQLCTLPSGAPLGLGVGLSPYSYAYASVNDMIYGDTQGAGAAFGQLALVKVDLTGPSSSIVYATGALLPAVAAYEIAWDSDAALILVACNNSVTEVDVVGMTFFNTTPTVGGNSFTYRPVYVSSLKKLFAIGWDNTVGRWAIFSYNTMTLALTVAMNDLNYAGVIGGGFGGSALCQFKDGSFISSASDAAFVNCGVRKLCLT